MVQKISHQNHLKLFLTNMLHYLSLDIMRQSYWIFIQSKLKVIFNKKIDAKIFFASSSKETNYFSSQRNRSVISFKMTLKFNSVEVFKGKVGVTLITEFWIDLNSDLSFSCEISNIQFRWGFQRQSIIFRFRIFSIYNPVLT